MQKGWGYGKNNMSLADRIRTSKKVKFESDSMKVYEYSWNDSSTYFNDVTVKYIMRKDTKKKTIVFSGFHKPMNYDVSSFKNQKDIFEHVANVLFNEYFKYNRDLESEYFDNKEAEPVQEVKETTQERAEKYLKGMSRVEEMKEKELNQLQEDINQETLQEVGTIENFNILVADPKVGYGKYLIIKDVITNKIYNWTAGGEKGILKRVKFLLT